MWFLIIVGFFFRVYLHCYHFSVATVLLHRVLLMSLMVNKWRLHLKPSVFCLCLCFKFNLTPSCIKPAVYWMQHSKHRSFIWWTHTQQHSLLLFLGNVLRWLIGTATTKDINSTQTYVNQLIETQMAQQETLVHIISVLNVTRYAVQINRHIINILMDKMVETSQDVNNLHNTTISLATNLTYHQVILYIRSVLANLEIHYPTS